MMKGILVNSKADDTFKAQLKMEHADLVAEMHTVENLPTHERLQLAKLRRAQQLKVARQKEKEWLKLQRVKGNNSFSGSTTGISNVSTHHFRSGNNSFNGRHISFENSVVLLEAASRNDMDEVADLLKRGITPDAANEDGLTALHQCCIDNNVQMLRLLLEYGANVDAKDSDKWTPLHAAATCGHLELVRILIDNGANLLAVNTDGNMPYDLCDDENTLDFIEAEMSKRGVTQELIDDTRSSTERQMLKDLMELARTGGDLEQPDEQGATPLHIASANGYVRVVEFLLELHVNVDALDKDQWSPVHAAACWGHIDVLEMLAQCGADLNVKNKDNETPSDICEDPEIRERIDQLKTEQESKRLAEAQRRRVRRSQSNNTRAQSVRRTSLRDKTLTTKKDAVEEARLRLQAQEIFTAPDSGVNERVNAATASSLNLENNETDATVSTYFNGSIDTAHNWQIDNNNRIDNNNSNKSYNVNNNNNNNYNEKKSYQSNMLPHSISADAIDAATATTTTTTTAMAAAATTATSRRPPDGRENDELQLTTYKQGTATLSEHHRSTSATALIVSDRNITKASLAANAVKIHSSKEASNGKINVQVTVLVDTNSATASQQDMLQQQQHDLCPSLTAATLANLKKQRSLSRTNVLRNAYNYENDTVLGTTTGTCAGNSNNHNNNSKSSNPVISEATENIVSNQPLGSNRTTAGNGTNNTDNFSLQQQQTSMNKFKGVTGDVVSDSTSSKKCCTLM